MYGKRIVEAHAIVVGNYNYVNSVSSTSNSEYIRGMNKCAEQWRIL